MKTTLIAAYGLIVIFCAWCAAGEYIPPMPMDAPMPGGPGNEGPGNVPGEAAPEKKEATVRVFLDADTIYLRDGTELNGTVILMAQKAAVILTEKGEQMVPRDTIEKVVLGKDKDKATTLPVRSQDGFLFIVMEPIEDEPIEGGDAGAAAPGAPAAPPAPPAAAQDPVAPRKATPVAPRQQQPGGGRRSPVAPKAGETEGGLKRIPPDHEDIKRLLDKDGKLKDLIEKAKQDPEMLERIKERLKKQIGRDIQLPQ